MTNNIVFNISPEEFAPEFLPLLENDSGILLLMGNRGSGKSVTMGYRRSIMRCLSRKYYRCVYSRKVARTIRDSTFQGFKDTIAEWGLSQYFKVLEATMTITCTLNGNKLLAFGLDEPEKAKGFKDISDVFLDEMTECTFKDYASLLGLLRTKKVKKTQFVGMFNPEYGFWGRNYFFKDHESDIIPYGYVEAKTANTTLYKADFRKNPFIDPVAYEAKLRELARGDENYLTVWIDGNWGSAVTGNEFYINFKRSQHVMKVPFVNYKPVHLTYDFNVLPYMTELCGQVVETETELQIRIFKEYCLESPLNSSESVCKAFLADYREDITDLLYYGDASGNSRIAGKGNKTAFDDIRQALAGFITESSNRTLKKNPSVLKRRDFINDILAGKIEIDGKKVVLMIDESCKQLINDLQKVKMGVDGKLKKRIMDKATGLSWEELGHTSDALEYFILKLLWDVFIKK